MELEQRIEAKEQGEENPDVKTRKLVTTTLLEFRTTRMKFMTRKFL